MEGLEIKDESDEMLRHFLQAAGAMESENSLTMIISEYAEPVIKGIIKAKLRVSLSLHDGDHLNQDALEISSSVKETILTELRGLKSNPRRKAIKDFQGYVAIVTFNACHDYLRRKYPRRHSLKNRLRYLLTHRKDFALWEGERGNLLCGEAHRRGQKRDAHSDNRLRALAEGEGDYLRSTFPTSDPARLNLPSLLTAIFKKLEGPAELDELAGAVARLQGIQEERAEQLAGRSDGDEGVDLVAELPDRGMSVVAQVDLKIYLEKLWEEIRDLPMRQRAAILLNLKDAQGNSMIEMLPITGVASVREIAAALEMSAREFASLWNDLPLDDNAIASRLGLTRQQVINLRKSARMRLARRMRDY